MLVDIMVTSNIENDLFSRTGIFELLVISKLELFSYAQLQRLQEQGMRPITLHSGRRHFDMVYGGIR